MLKINLILILIVILSGCKYLLGPDEELTLECKPFNNDALRLDGYYYSSSQQLDENTAAYFLYQNGMIHSFGAFPITEMKEREKLFYDSAFIEKVRKIKFFWGVFNVDEKDIIIEMWYPGNGPLLVYRELGKILNDTTFIIYETGRLDGTEKKSVNQIYRFRQFSPKPDSINNFLCKAR